MIQSFAVWFNQGGSFMWVILIVAAISLAVSLERMIYYYFICRTNGLKMVADIAKALNNGNIAEAKRLTTLHKTPVDVLARTAIENFEAGMTIDEIQESVEEVAIKELPRLANRLNYLSLFANIATLLGLLGTITGLQVSFGSLNNVEAAKKAAMLAAGIAQAMNTTAFGLSVAVPCMVLYTIFSNKKEQLVKELDETVVRLLNYLKKKKA